MKRLFFLSTIALATAILLLFVITCKKEHSYEGGRVAKYTFTGAPDTCTAAEVSGTFTAGVAADTSNYVTVFIKVTSPGSAQVTTATVDGLTFSTGKLDLTVTPDSSSYSLILHATGTPKTTGTFTVDIPGSPGCSFTLTVPPPVPAGYALSGAPSDCSNPEIHGDFQKGTATTIDNYIIINTDVSDPGPYHIVTNKVHGVSFSASGAFSATGTRQVQLQAVGTPDTVGLVRFILTADDGSQCSFYVGFASSGVLATYVLQSSGQSGVAYCSPGTVQGTYTAGTPLDATNTLKVNAYVTVVGDYTIATTAADGMVFSASGTFTTTGSQDVFLPGTGTPSAIGTFTFFPTIVGPAPLGGATCGLDVMVK